MNGQNTKWEILEEWEKNEENDVVFQKSIYFKTHKKCIQAYNTKDYPEKKQSPVSNPTKPHTKEGLVSTDLCPSSLCLPLSLKNGSNVYEEIPHSKPAIQLSFETITPFLVFSQLLYQVFCFWCQKQKHSNREAKWHRWKRFCTHFRNK